ncbi:pilus assembly protein TadE [Kineococcus sp. R8]|uniref:TadE/TadG family type IV pilus assembly protein n=1 Tax=Kineococcus siccus TaxID=2696567 RepID=UPI001412A0A9|nr:pilus assembly protein TadE [Kineococcus siccus]
MTGPGRGTTRRGDAGSIALEFTLVAPVLLVLLALLLTCARAGQVRATFDAGVRDAARSATLSRSAPAAQARAREVLLSSLGAGDCADTLVVDPLVEFTPGRPVTVSASCSYAVSDLGLPGVPGRLRVVGSFASPLDPNRETT